MRLRIGGAVVTRNPNLSRIRGFDLSDASGKRGFPGLFEHPIDFGRGTGSMVDLRVRRFHLPCCFCDVIEKIADFSRITVSSFQSLSAFAAGDSDLLLG